MHCLRRLLLAAWLPATLLMPGCGPPERAAARPRALGTGTHELREDRSVYDQDDLTEVPVIRLTVWDLEGLEDVLEDEPGAEVAVRFRSGSFGEGVTVPNGRMRQRGKSARLARQKSFRVKLDDGAGRWKGQKTIHLLKNPWDLTRARNSIGWEHCKAIPHLACVRHQFVNVFLNGEDQGLYEWIEHTNDDYLEAHGLDKDGTLYKVEDFLARPYEDDIFDCTGAEEQCLEVENNSDPAKLERMLDAVNDPGEDINDVIDRHFERNNYETWLATMILLSNYDTASQNHFLYSPSDSERWYFLPWDFNGAWDFWGQPDWEDHPRRRDLVAPGYWFRHTLHRRYLSDPENVESLRARLNQLRASPLTDARTRRILEAARPIVRRFVQAEPDIDHLPVSDRSRSAAEKLREWDGEWARLGLMLAPARRAFDETVEWPLPLTIRSPRQDGSRVRFFWEPGFDLQGDGLTYDLQVHRSPDLRTPTLVAERLGLTGTDASIGGLGRGTYYFTVIVRDDDDPDEHWQLPNFRHPDTRAGITYPGVRQFTVPLP